MARIKENVEPPDGVPVSPQWMKRGGYEETGRKATRGPLYRTPQPCQECHRRGRAHECLVPSLRPAPNGFLCLPCTGCNGVWKSPCSFSVPGWSWRWDATRQAFVHERLNGGEQRPNSLGASKLGNKPTAAGGKKDSGSGRATSMGQAGPSRAPLPGPSRRLEGGPSREPKAAPSRDPKAILARDPKAGPSRPLQSGPPRDPKSAASRKLRTILPRDPQTIPQRDPKVVSSRGPKAEPQAGPSRPLESGASLKPKAAPSHPKRAVEARIPKHITVIEILDSDSDPDSDDGDDILINLRKRMAMKRKGNAPSFTGPSSKRPRNDVSNAPSTAAPLIAPNAAVAAVRTAPATTNTPTTQYPTEVTRKIETGAFERPNGIQTARTEAMGTVPKVVEERNDTPSVPTTKPVPSHAAPTPGIAAAAPVISPNDDILLLEAELEATRDERDAAIDELNAAINARDKAREERNMWLEMHTNLLAMYSGSLNQGTLR